MGCGMADFPFAPDKPCQGVTKRIPELPQLAAGADIRRWRVLPVSDGPGVLSKLQHWLAKVSGYEQCQQRSEYQNDCY